MIKFLLVMNHKGIVRLLKEFNHHYNDTFYLDNQFIYTIFQKIISHKGQGINNIEIKHIGCPINICYRKYANLFFVLGSDNSININDVKHHQTPDTDNDRKLLLIHNLVENIDFEFKMKSTEENFIYDYDRINQIVNSMNFI